MDQKWEDKAYNLTQCEAFVKRASKLGAELVIFPEMTMTGFTMNTKLSAENADDSESIKRCSEIADASNVALIVGVVLKYDAQPRNTLAAFASDGTEQARYSKIHPFSFSGENQHFQSGSHLARMQLGKLSLGFSICYDLRFPELFSALAQQSDVLINIANWPKARLDHWLTLIKARAIENQVYMIGVNRTGADGNGLEYESSSVIYNPDGGLLIPEHLEGELAMYEVSNAQIKSFREGFSTRHDRRTDLYKKFLN